MSLKLFIYISILVHIVGGIAIYFHYNPIDDAPEVVNSVDEELGLEEEETSVQKPPEKKMRKLRKKQPFALKKIPQVKKPKAEGAKGLPKKIPQVKKPKEQATKAQKLRKDVFIEEESNESSEPDLKILKMVEEDIENPQSDQVPKAAEIQNKKDSSPQKKAAEIQNKKNSSLQKKATEIQNIEDMEEVEEVEEAIKKSSSQLDQALEEAKKTQKVLKKMELEAMEELEEDEKKVSPTLGTKNKKNVKSYRNFFSLKQKRGNPEITYPEFARKDNLQGSLIVHYYVTKEGLVDQISLNQSSGHSEIDNYVLRSLSRYEFLPNQESWVKHEVNFILKGKEKEMLRLRQK